MILSRASIKACKAASMANPNVIPYIYFDSYLPCVRYYVEKMELSATQTGKYVILIRWELLIYSWNKIKQSKTKPCSYFIECTVEFGNVYQHDCSE